MKTTRPCPCGFCASGSHALCPGSIQNATKPDAAGDRTWTCPCSKTGHVRSADSSQVK